MKPLASFISVLLVLLLMSTAHAQESPSLDDAIARALAHSSEVAMAEAKVSYTEAQVRAARRGWFRPQVSVFAGDSVVTAKMRAGIQVTQDLDRLLTLNRDEVRQAEHALILAQQELILAKERVTRQVSDAHLQLQHLDQLIHRRAQTVMDRDTIYHLVQTQFEVGAVPLEHLLATQEALASAEQRLLEAQLELSKAEFAFAQLLGDAG